MPGLVFRRPWKLTDRNALKNTETSRKLVRDSSIPPVNVLDVAQCRENTCGATAWSLIPLERLGQAALSILKKQWVCPKMPFLLHMKTFRRIISILGVAPGLTGIFATGELLFPDYVAGWADQEQCLPEISQEEPVFADQALKDILAKVVDSGFVVFTVFVNTRDREEGRRFASNMEAWMCRVRSVLGSSFLAFVDSEKLRKHFESQYGVSAYFSKEWINEAFKGRGDGERHDSNYWRWVAMESILRAGYSALYVDTDIMWLDDPRPQLGALPVADFYGSCDNYDAGTGSVRWYQNGSLDMEQLREESKKHEDESVCCQGFLVPVNAGIVLMRPFPAAIEAVLRFRQRVISGPCWGQAAMQWTLFELCGNSLRCQILDPLRFASASPLMQELRRQRGKASYQPSLIHLDLDGKRKTSANQFFERIFGVPKECGKEGRQREDL
eukprot:s1957_g24.t1